MIHIVTPGTESRYKDQMAQAYRLRDRVFLEQQGRDDHTESDDLALDEFDNKNAVHMLYVDEGDVFGYQRLLPTTSPHVLSDVLPELCMGDSPVGAHIWEVSHHCIDPGHPWGRRSASTIATELGLALVEWGFEWGVTHFVIEIDAAGILPLVQLHVHPLPLGLPRNIRGRDMIAVMVVLDNRTLRSVRRLSGYQKRLLAAAARPAFLQA